MLLGIGNGEIRSDSHISTFSQGVSAAGFPSRVVSGRPADTG